MTNFFRYLFFVLCANVFLSQTVLSQIIVPTYSKKDSAGFNNTQMTNLDSVTLYVRDGGLILIDDCNKYKFKKMILNAYFYAGNPYPLGDIPHRDSVGILIKGYSSFTGGTGLLLTYTAELKINEGAPEQIFMRDISAAAHALVNRFVIKITH